MTASDPPFTRVLTTPVRDLIDHRDIARVLEAATAVASSWKAPAHGRSLRQILPPAVERTSKRLAGHLLMPDEALLRRAVDHPLIDKIVTDFVTRLLAGYATHQGGEADRSTGLLSRVPLSKVTSSLTDSMSVGIRRFTASQHPEIVAYLIATLTTVEKLPDFADWRTHVVDAVFATPLARVLPDTTRTDLEEARSTLADAAVQLRADLGDRAVVDLLEELGFAPEPVRRLAAVLDEVLASSGPPSA